MTMLITNLKDVDIDYFMPRHADDLEILHLISTKAKDDLTEVEKKVLESFYG